MTNAKRGSGSHRWVYLCTAAALGFALSGCGGSSQAASSAAISAPASAAHSTTISAASGAAISAAASTAIGTAASAGATDSYLPTPSTGAVTLNWTPPTEEANGAPLTNLAGYVIHYGTASQDYAKTITVSNPGIATYVVDDLKPGTYFFTVAAVDSSGNESPLSSEVTATVD